MFCRYPKFMKDHCSVTCGLCSSGSIGSVTNPITVALRCYDKDKRCPAWAAYANQCQSNRLFMSRMCKKTCGLCDKEKQNGNDHNTDENMRTSMATNLRTPKFWRDGVFCILSTILYTYLYHCVWKSTKMSHLHFPPIFVLLKLTCLVTLFDRKLQVFKNSPKWIIFVIFN